MLTASCSVLLLRWSPGGLLIEIPADHETQAHGVLLLELLILTCLIRVMIKRPTNEQAYSDWLGSSMCNTTLTAHDRPDWPD